MANKSKKKNAIIVVIIILVVLLIIGLIVKWYTSRVVEDPNFEGVTILPGIPNDPNRSTISNWKLKKEQCIDDICVKNVKITCYDDRGNITYVVTNKGKEKASGYLKLVFENYSAIIVYKDIEPGKSSDGFTGYSGYDLRKVNNYKLEKLKNNDYAIIAP